MSASRRHPTGTPAGASPARRRSRRIIIVITAVAAVALAGVPSALGMAWQPWNGGDSAVGDAASVDLITKVPGDDPARGLVHSGLKPGKKGEMGVECMALAFGETASLVERKTH